MPRRILCIDQFATIGGAQQCLLELAPFVHQKGCELDVILPGPGPLGRKLQTIGSTLRYFAGASLSRAHKPAWEVAPYLFSVRQAARAMAESIQFARPDLCYVTGARYLPAAAWVASRFKLPILFHAHNRLTQRTALYAVRAALRNARTRVITCCEYVAASLRPAIPNDRIQVTFNGTADMQTSLAKNLGRIQSIGTLGRIAPEKGQVAFAKVARSFEGWPNLRWIVVGSASGEPEHQKYLRTVMRESEGCGITFAGWQEDVGAALASIDLLIVPSLPYDAAPRVIAEAFSAGVPVLACPSGGIPEMVDDGVNGFLSRGCEASDIARRLAGVLQLSPATVHHITANARSVWGERYTLDAYHRKVWDAMESASA